MKSPNMNASYLSNLRPDFTPFELDCGKIRAYSFQGNLQSELAAGRINPQTAADLLEDMLMVREMEEMIVKLRTGAYEPLGDFNYRGPTHVSIGQEAASVGACGALTLKDHITSTHRGHGDAVARGCGALRAMDEERLLRRIPHSQASSHAELLEEALEEHVYRTLAELFGKEEGYCKGRGGSMHIADFTVGHLGANAIVGGSVPIATGAALGIRYLRTGGIVCCFAGDGAFSNGVVLESLNFAAQYQFTNELAGDYRFGMPIIFLILNNHYGMTGRAEKEVSGVRELARRAAGFSDCNMHAEIVNGMDVLAVRDAVRRMGAACRSGEGPCLVDVNTYRYYGHSLSDPRNEYRTREEEEAWKAVDPIRTFEAQLLECGIVDQEKLEAVRARVVERNARAAIRAAASPDPHPADVIKYMYTDTSAEEVPPQYKTPAIPGELPVIKRVNGEISYRDAIKEGLIEEMQRDARVILYGEDVAEYGGAFKLTKGLLEAFGRARVFNTPISEAAICGTAVGAAMVGTRPVVELMYMDFLLMAGDQVSNQASKWHYMSGAQVEIPMVIRASIGGGKGYGGQHSQTLESLVAHVPGMYVVYPATPYDAKGLIKSAIRDNNPVMYLESQLLYGEKGVVPEEEYMVPLGVADIKRRGNDITLVAWGPAVLDALKAADQLQQELGVSAEVVDLRSLVPLDTETVLASVEKTGRCVVASQCVTIGSYMGEIVSTIQEQVFDYLDAPILRVGAKNGIAPQSHVLEAVFLPKVSDIVQAAKAVL
ncbi:MAG: dehydrogenase E1 component subunit alpha/beta [Acidobacteriia bacterium]|nr:dehydrogenase E1 component subunit alpha/beta [Terriglobia bacterium]